MGVVTWTIPSVSRYLSVMFAFSYVWPFPRTL